MFLTSLQEAIIRLLYSIASKKEVERYLRIFSTANKFAVIKVGGAILTCVSPFLWPREKPSPPNHSLKRLCLSVITSKSSLCPSPS